MSELPAPYWNDDWVTLYHGDARDLLPHLTGDCVITDPPYGETALEWDRWQDGWVAAVGGVAPQMWCFGSLRMFLDRRDEFRDWKLAQEIVWEKHNGSGFDRDRFRRVHELALHFYRGPWKALPCEAQMVPGEARPSAQIRLRTGAGEHRSVVRESSYEYGRERLQRSVIFARSCHGRALHPTQKPEGIVRPLMLYSVPVGGTVIDCFAGSGTVLQVARTTGRRAIGIEINERYCQVIAERLAQQVLIA